MKWPLLPEPVRRLGRQLVAPVRQVRDLLDVNILGPRSSPGSTHWLVWVEHELGGYFHDSTAAAYSSLDKRVGMNGHPGHEGGDRMARSRHGYCTDYADALAAIEPKVIVEIGILRGTGLATWSLLFPQATILALDIDFRPFENHSDYLVSRGAFSQSHPFKVVFDAFQPNVSDDVIPILAGRSIDLVIDDGPHDCQAVVETARSLKPLLSRGATYIVEDALECAPAVIDVIQPRSVTIGRTGLIVLEVA